MTILPPWRRTVLGCLLALALLTPAMGQNIQDMSLRAAINDGRTEEAKGLLEQGADVNGRTSGGYTPLMIAAGVGNEEMVRLLLARGADPTLVNDYGWTAGEVAKMNNYRSIQALLEQASTAGQPEATVTKTQPESPARREAPVTAAGRDSRGWPKLGAYPPGREVLYSGTAGKTWSRGTVTSLDPTYGYNVEGVTGSTDPYFVVGPEREPFWTDWFLGDWSVSVPMAMGVTVQDGDLYRTVSGGMRLPPLRISKDGSYTWRYQGQGGETVLRGRWRANPDGPGVILQQADGADWLVYNNTRTGSALGQTVILSSEKHTYLDGSRL